MVGTSRIAWAPTWADAEVGGRGGRRTRRWAGSGPFHGGHIVPSFFVPFFFSHTRVLSAHHDRIGAVGVLTDQQEDALDRQPDLADSKSFILSCFYSEYLNDHSTADG